MKEINSIQSIFRMIIKSVIIVLLLEITVFNYRHWQSLEFESIKMPDYQLGTGIEKIDENYLIIADEKNAYIEFADFTNHIDNIYLDIERETDRRVNIQINATDAANAAEAFNVGSTVVVRGVEKSKYLRVNLSGNSTEFRIIFSVPIGTRLKINDIQWNKHVPFHFSAIRMCVEFVVLVLICFFRPRSIIYRYSVNLCSREKKLIVAGMVLLQCLILLMIGQLMIPSKTVAFQVEDGWPAYEQYNEQADALLKGQLWLDREPPASLSNASNPYDGGVRWKAVVIDGNEMFDYDYAYYNGKYYSYFGVVPTILFYLPYKALTGNDLSTWIVVSFCSVLFCVASYMFIYSLCRKYMQTISFGMYLVLATLYVFGSSVVYLVYWGIVYSVPIIMSMLLGTIGLYFWVSSSDGKKVKIWKLVIGSLCIALIAGCRPQLVLIFLFAIPIFWNETLKERLFFSKKGIKNTVAIMLPFFIIAALLMYYNYARFGSVFDFGSNYNLTSNDMTHRGFNFDRIPLGIFVYLLQPFTITNKYPYMKVADMANDYLGFTNIEFIFGGFFALNTISVVNIFVFKLKKILNEYKVFAFTLTASIIAIIVMLLDIQMAGLTQRYLSDFAWLGMLSTVFILGCLEMKMRTTKNKQLKSVFMNVVVVLTFVCVFVNIWNVFIVGRYSNLETNNAWLYYTVKYLMPFV